MGGVGVIHYREEVTLLRDLKKAEGRSQARWNSGKKSFPGTEGTASSKTRMRSMLGGFNKQKSTFG